MLELQSGGLTHFATSIFIWNVVRVELVVAACYYGVTSATPHALIYQCAKINYHIPTYSRDQ